MIAPFVADPDLTLYVGDVRDVLKTLPDGSVHCCVTSPPYWGLRDYGVVGQLGLEATPDEYVAAMVAVFREVRRVLRADGTCWLNMGDSYSSNPKGMGGDDASTLTPSGTRRQREAHLTAGRVPGLKIKDLCGVPWRLAFALQADGWYLRSDIVWAKPNPMPESVTDRPTKSHEYVFLLSKSPRYWFDAEAVREPHSPDGRKVTRVVGQDGSIQHRDGERWPNGGRNLRSVWEIATQPYPDAHFATFPEALPDRCIRAGCPEWVCGTCGAPRTRIVERAANIHPGDSGRNELQGPVQRGKRTDGKAIGTVMRERHEAGRSAETLGWSDCGHGNYKPGVVLDPFGGSGTTALVARRLGRRSILVELNADYARLAARRLQQLSLLAEGAAG